MCNTIPIHKNMYDMNKRIAIHMDPGPCVFNIVSMAIDGAPIGVPTTTMMCCLALSGYATLENNPVACVRTRRFSVHR